MDMFLPTLHFETKYSKQIFEHSYTEALEGKEELPFMFVDDAAFPLLDNLLRPYPK